MKTYFVKDINQIFTNKINNYFQNGYTVFTNTMSGTQGEQASIHLLSPDKKVVLRLSLDSHYSLDKRMFTLYTREYLASTLRHMNELGSGNDVLWENHGKVIDEISFYQISSGKQNFYGDEEAMRAAFKLRYERQEARYEDEKNIYKDITSKKVIKTILPLVKRQPKCTSVIPRDIYKVEKVIGNVWDSKARCYQRKSYYAVTLKNKTIRLGERPAS